MRCTVLHAFLDELFRFSKQLIDSINGIGSSLYTTFVTCVIVQWLDELKLEYPWLYLRPMDANLTRYCAVPIDRQLRLKLIVGVLSEDRGGGGGGLYVGSNTWLVNFPPSMRSVDLDLALDDDAAEGYLVLREGVLNSSTSDPDGGIKRALDGAYAERVRRRSSCARIHHIYREPGLVNRTGACFVVVGDGFERFFPADIWELQDDFGRLVRRLFYGHEEIRRPQPTFDDLVPNIGHMIWVGGGRMSYVFYLSVVSLLYVAKVDTVYIHGDQPPSGEYWTQLMTESQTKSKVKFIKRTLPLQVEILLSLSGWSDRPLQGISCRIFHFV